MKKILSILLCICFVVACFLSVSAESVDELRAQQKALEEQEAEYQAILDAKNAEVSDQQEVVDAIVGKVQTINEEIKLSHEKIDSLDKSILEKQASIDQKNLDIEDKMDVLRQRIKTIYLAGDVSSLEIILGAKDFNDFLDKVQLVKSVSTHDEELINEVKGQIEVVTQEKEDLQVDKLEQETEEKKLQEKQEELNETLDENKEVLAHLQAESNDALSNLSLTAEQIASIEDEIAAQQEAEAASHSNYSGGYNTHAAGMDLDIDLPDDGSWVWPSPGAYTISSDFWDSEDRSYAHGATDICGAYGTPIVAVTDGYVEYVCDCCTHNWGKFYNCGCGGGYGNYVQIDHGNGYEVIYAHLQSVCVSSGASVSAGQVIGYMGSTGHSTGAHLHFEARYCGTKFDPMSKY